MIAEIFYVGSQLMVFTYIYQYAESVVNGAEEAILYGIADLCIFLVGRWVGTYLLQLFTGGRLLFIYAVGAPVMTLIAIFLQGMVGLYSLLSIHFFMSVMFPTIYARNPKVQEWESLMDSFQQRLPFAEAGEKWVEMDRIFKL